MTDRKPGYYFFRFRSPGDTVVRFWDGANWRFAQDGYVIEFTPEGGDGFLRYPVVQEVFLAEPLTWDHYVYYGDHRDESVYSHRYPIEGDELCDGHQIHYEWRDGKWR